MQLSISLRPSVFLALLVTVHVVQLVAATGGFEADEGHRKVLYVGEVAGGICLHR